MLKNKSCQNCVLTIPLCRGGRDKTTSENGVKMRRQTWPHSPSLSGKASAPDGLTRPMWIVTWWTVACRGWCQPDAMMTSAWHWPVNIYVSIVGPTCHVIRIQCSWSYVQPDLRLNLSRLLGQNCFDQILAVWSGIWTIQDMFPANLIIPDAMVWSDRWDSRPKMVVVNY